MGNTHVPLMSSLLVGRGGAALATASAMLDEVIRGAVIRGVRVKGKQGSKISASGFKTIVAVGGYDQLGGDGDGASRRV